MINTETHIGWQDYLAIITRRRWFFLAPAAAIVAISLIVGLFLPRIYRAETILLIQDQQVINPLIEGLAVSTPVAERLRTLREEILSWTSLSRLANELKLDRGARSPLAFERLIKRLQSAVEVRMRGRDLITINYEDRDPILAQTLVNTVTNIYMQRNVESQSAETGTAITFIESEMAVYKKKLEDSERALREFKELYVMQMPVANQINEQIVELEVALARMLIENTEQHPTVIQTRRHIEELKQRRNDEIKRVITTALVKGADPKIYQDLAEALQGPSTLSESSDPAIKAAQEAYKAWVQRMDSSLAKNEQSSAPQIQVVTASSGQSGNSMEVIGSSSASISLAPREEQELVRLTRDYDVYSDTYKEMQERLERAKVTQRLGESDEGTKFKVLEPARLPLKPVRPNMMKIFFFSLLLGLFVGAGVAFVAEYLDQSFQSSEELQTALEIPVLGAISTIITEDDLEERRRRRKGWVSFQANLQRAKVAAEWAFRPVWGVVDRALVRWGL